MDDQGVIDRDEFRESRESQAATLPSIQSNQSITYGKSRELTAEEALHHVNVVREIQARVMQEGAHYGVIPGTKKPTLYKAGAEVLRLTFRFAEEVQVDDLSAGGEIRYRVKTLLYHIPSGSKISEGVGECSSQETKYKWRAAVSKEEYEYFPADARRTKFEKNNDQPILQVRIEPADVANTILKMARKRSGIDAIMSGAAASEVFTQDVEDMDPQVRGQSNGAVQEKEYDFQPEVRYFGTITKYLPAQGKLPHRYEFKTEYGTLKASTYQRPSVLKKEQKPVGKQCTVSIVIKGQYKNIERFAFGDHRLPEQKEDKQEPDGNKSAAEEKPDFAVKKIFDDHLSALDASAEIRQVLDDLSLSEVNDVPVDNRAEFYQMVLDLKARHEKTD